MKLSAPPSSSLTGRSRRGVALVITLIMLSIITFLAVAFLSLSRRERAAVTVTLDQTDTRLMVDAGFARAQQDIMNRFFNAASLLNYDLVISTNGDGSNIVDGVPFTVLDVAALSNDARVPVFVQTNLNPGVPWDYRYYLDLNRNRANEYLDPLAGIWGDPHWVGVLESPNPFAQHSRFNKFLGRYAFIALPVSKSLDANYVHNSAKSPWNPNPILATNLSIDAFVRNQGFGNWEYNLAGFLTDLNPNFWFYPPYNTNLAAQSAVGGLGDSWISAIDLLSWRYGNNLGLMNSLAGTHPNFAIDAAADGIDAYGDGDGVPGASRIGGLDSYFDSRPLIGNDNTNYPWSGSRNPNALVSIEEFLSQGARYPVFYDRMTSAMYGANAPFDRNTFYRMLAQMGTDSAPPQRTRLVASGLFTNLPNGNVQIIIPNHDFRVGDHVRVLNPTPPPPFGLPIGGTFRVVGISPNTIEYEDNLVATFYVPPRFTGGPPAHYLVARNNKIHLNYNNQNRDEERHWPWTAREFFLTVGDRLLRLHTNSPVTNVLSVTNIPVWDHLSRNAYDGKVHQLLQITANLWDATTTNSQFNPDFPTVFRPILRTYDTTNAMIADWIVEPDAQFRFRQGFGGTNRYVDLTAMTNRMSLTSNDIAFGQPFVLGAKKGHPNFNELSLQTSMEIARKLSLSRPNTNSPPNQTNQMYVMRLDQTLGLEAWNSYTNPNFRDLRMEVYYNATFCMTNGSNTIVWPAIPTRTPIITNFVFATNYVPFAWPSAVVTQSFQVPILTNFALMTNAIWLQGVQAWRPMTNTPDYARYETNLASPFYAPDWTLVITNRMQFYLIDVASNKVVDFVNLTNEAHVNLMDTLTGQQSRVSQGPDPRRFWNTNRLAGPASPTVGIDEQVRASLNTNDPAWNAYIGNLLVNSKTADVRKFQLFMNPVPPPGTNGHDTYMQTPFNPYRRVYRTVSWQANDPLVHYTSGDLFETNVIEEAVRSLPPPALGTLGALNDRYQPWGGKRPVLGPPDGTAAMPQYDYNVAFKDPMVRWSDEWNFPSNHLGNVGMIGRVHRGTPWQTIYLKAKDITSLDEWFVWSGHRQTQPTNDLVLADLFTVAVDDESQRGLLSVNQSNSAAWAALLSGVPFLADPGPFNSTTNWGRPVFNPRFIGPGSPEFTNFHFAIQNARTNLPNLVFSNLAQFLAVPELSVGANAYTPMFTTNSTEFLNGMVDQSYERFADQVLSLVTVEETPRFAVYVWGQSLKPAPNSLFTGAGPNFNLCTNYQITGESAAKAIIRVEKRFNPVNPAQPTLHAVVESFQYLPTP